MLGHIGDRMREAWHRAVNGRRRAGRPLRAGGAAGRRRTRAVLAVVLTVAVTMLAVSAYAEGDAGEAAELRERVGERFRDCEECPELVVVPAGSYLMGSPPSEEGRADNEGPQRRVTIAESFAVGVYEVTFEEWAACVEGGGCGGYRPDDEGRGRGGRPVINVSWEDAQQFVAWLREETGMAYRLLSEAEWEYVARAGTDTARYWGESESGQCRYANAADVAAKSWISTEHHDKLAPCDDGHDRTSPVGSYAENDFGLHDVLGNVMEWTQDCYAGAPTDNGSPWRRGECGSRVVRGGAWHNTPSVLRSAYRLEVDADIRSRFVGFRVARFEYEYRRAVPLPRYRGEEEGKLRQNTAGLICNLVVTGSDFDQIMAGFKAYFGEDVLFEEAYPNVRCENMTVLPSGYPEADLIRITLENPGRMLKFLKQVMYYFRNNA